MSTRAAIHFHWRDEEQPSAIIYNHSDGYPSGLGVMLQRFFDEVEGALSRKKHPMSMSGTRFGDPAYLAAKWVVWKANQQLTSDREMFRHIGRADEGERHYLDFTSIGVIRQDPCDIEFRYRVRCYRDDQRPVVVVEAVRGQGGVKVLGTWPLPEGTDGDEEDEE